MIKCTDSLFSETSPTTFFRKHIKQQSEQKSQITEAQVIEKLKIILLTIREESTKAFSNFQYQNKKLQTQNQQQFCMIRLLQEENSFITKVLETYVQKFSQIGPEISAISNIKKTRSQLEIKILQKENLSNDFQNSTPKISSNLRTNYISRYHHQQNQDSASQFQTAKTQESDNQLSQLNSFSGIGSSTSSFHKKYYPYHQENAQKSQHFETGILISETQQPHLQISKIFQIQTINCSQINDIPSQFQEVRKDYELGLESKGENFFSVDSAQIQEKNISETSQNGNKVFNLEDQSFSESQYFLFMEQNDEFDLEGFETDSDIKRESQMIDTNLENRQIPKTLLKEEAFQKSQLLFQIKTNTISGGSQLKAQNSSYFKNLDLHEKLKEQHDSPLIIEKKHFSLKNEINENQNNSKKLKIGPNKLKTLFQPLPFEIISKKIALPILNSQNKNFYVRECLNSQKSNEIVKPMQMNNQKLKTGGFQTKKSTNLSKRIL